MNSSNQISHTQDDNNTHHKGIKTGRMKSIITMAKNNGYTIGVINDFRTKLTIRKRQQHPPPPTIPYIKRRWVTFNYYSPMISLSQTCSNILI